MANKRGIQLSTSLHAEQRIRERLGIENKREIKEVNKNAYHKGLNIKKHYIPRATLWFIDRKVSNYFGRCNTWRIYKNHLFLYSRNLTLVTVIPLPVHLQIKKTKEELERW